LLFSISHTNLTTLWYVEGYGGSLCWQCKGSGTSRDLCGDLLWRLLKWPPVLREISWRGSLGIRCFIGVGVPSFYWDLPFYTWTGWWTVFVFFQLYNSDLFLFWTKYLRSSSYNSYKNCLQKKVKGTPLERLNICVNFGFARLIWRPFIRSTEKRGCNHFFGQCSLHISLRFDSWFKKIDYTLGKFSFPVFFATNSTVAQHVNKVNNN
jgi:hypothetical protein